MVLVLDGSSERVAHTRSKTGLFRFFFSDFRTLSNRNACFSDNYEIIDPSLDDILYQLNPMFTEEDLKELHYYEEVMTHHFLYKILTDF